MARDLTVTIGTESFTFDAEKVNGLDAWAFYDAVGLDLPTVVSGMLDLADAGQAPPFHIAVVAKWLAARQGVNPLVSFSGIAAATVLPFPEDD